MGQSDDVQVLINAYLRAKHYRHAATVCNEVLRKNVGDAEPVLYLWRAFANLMEGHHTEALRELSPLVNNRETEVAATAAMIMAHKGARFVDEDAVSDLEGRLKELERSAAEQGLMQAAYLYWHTGRYEKAHTLAQRVLRVQRDYPAATVLQGWVELSMDPDDDVDGNDVSNIEDARRRFEMVLESAKGGDEGASRCELEAMLGMAKCYELKRLPKKALAELGAVASKFPWFEPTFEDQIRVLMSCGDWDGAVETSQNLLARDAYNIEALRTLALFHVAVDANTAEAVRLASELLAAIDRTEPQAAQLYVDCARPLARVSCGDASILQITQAMCERAQKAKPQDSAAFTEHAHQLLIGKDVQGALAAYRRASEVDGLDVGAMLGAIRCQTFLGMYDDAASQVEFLAQMGSTVQQDSLPLAIVQASLAYHRDMDSQRCVELLDGAVRDHVSKLVSKPFGYEFFETLEPSLLLEVAQLYLVLAPQEPRTQTEGSSPLLAKCKYCVESTTRVAPGLISASLLIAKCHFLDGLHDSAISALRAVLQTSPSSTEAHILLSQVYLHLGRIKQAGQELEQALSYNFAVRDSPAFVVANGKVLMHDGKYDEAVRNLEAAMKLPGVAKPLADPTRAASGDAVTLSDRASIFLLLAEAHTKLKAYPEAAKLINEAVAEFQGTTEEVRVMLANCDLSLAKGDTSRALRKLRDIPADSPHYLRARMAMAQIYLKHKNDRHAYAQCYEDLAAKYPDVQTLCMLGEALLQVQEPERAVRAFEQALKQNPRDRALASKMGKALVMTHDYQKAVDYYERAMAQNDVAADAMALELAELYRRLRRLDRAQSAVAHLLKLDTQTLDTDGLKNVVAANLLMSKVYESNGDRDAALMAKQRALEVQNFLISRMLGDSAAELSLQHSAAADLSCEVATDCQQTRHHVNAQQYYEAALTHVPGHTMATLSLAKLHLANGDADACQQMCVALLRVDPDNEDASMILAELMAQREHNETAIYHFQQLLQKNPANFKALSQLVQLLRRAGRLDEAGRYLRSAETAGPRTAHEPGLNYCRGVYARLMNEPHEALRLLNYARKDSEWGNEAIYQMIEVYLRPGTDAIFHSEDADGLDGLGDERAPEPRSDIELAESVHACEKLLGEVKGPRSQRHRVLECYTMMASRRKQHIDDALAMLLEMASNERDCVPVLLALAAGFTLQKQTAKARNYLKRVHKMPYNAEEGEDFERSWLLLADIHIAGGKFDLAQELCRRAIQYNKSCARGWELLGGIMEREQAYRDAAEHYERAFKFEHELSPTVGYKLAFNYLKAKRYVDAIETSKKVLLAFPKYPKLRQDVLLKAQAMVRA